jgi:septal ring factor EnvC (AmiA/AmiB activator)
MQSLDTELDQSNKKIKNLEENISRMQKLLSKQQESITETQRYLIKVAHGQQELTKRVMAWPFITVSTKKTKDV